MKSLQKGGQPPSGFSHNLNTSSISGTLNNSFIGCGGGYQTHSARERSPAPVILTIEQALAEKLKAINDYQQL